MQNDGHGSHWCNDVYAKPRYVVAQILVTQSSNVDKYMHEQFNVKSIRCTVADTRTNVSV